MFTEWVDADADLLMGKSDRNVRAAKQLDSSGAGAMRKKRNAISRRTFKTLKGAA